MMPNFRRENPYQELLARGLEAEGCRVVFPRGRSHCWWGRGLPLFRAVRDEQGLDLLHLHWTGPYLKGRGLARFLGYLARFMADLAAVRASGCRIVWTLHNFVPHETRHQRLELVARRWLCRMASAVIVHGHAGREAAVESFGCPANRVFVIPHGHYREAYGPPLPGPDARQRLGLPGDARVFLFFGYLRPYKGLELLLDAWRELSPPGARLLVVGQSQKADYAAELAKRIAAAPGRAVARPLCAARRGPGFLQCGGRGGAALSRRADLGEPVAGDELWPAGHRPAPGRVARDAGRRRRPAVFRRG